MDLWLGTFGLGTLARDLDPRILRSGSWDPEGGGASQISTGGTLRPVDICLVIKDLSRKPRGRLN